MRTAHNAWHRCAQNADHLAHNTPFSPFFAEVVCTVGTTQPQTAISSSPNGGNGVTRTSTRRRHADSQLLMLQNPHHSQPRAPGCIEDQRRVNFFALIPTVGPRGANFFACMTQPRGDVETDITSAPEKRTKTPISHPHRRWRFHLRLGLREQRRHRFQTTGPPRLQQPDATPMGGDDTTGSQMSHII